MLRKTTIALLFGFIFSCSFIFAEDKKAEYTSKDEKTGEVTKVKVDGDKSEIKVTKKSEDGKTEETVENISVDKDGTKMTVTSKDKDGKVKQSSVIGGKIPDNFRKDVPVYKGATVMVCTIEGETQTLMLTTEEEFTKVEEFYKTEIVKNAWKINDTQNFTMNNVQSETFQCAKDKDDLTVSIMVTEQNGKKSTMITLNISKTE